MKVLVVGRGGREHALCVKIKNSPLVSEVFVAPGNPGMKEAANLVPIKEWEQGELVRFAQSEGMDLVIIGPEQPLLDGLTNSLQRVNIRVFAPTQAAAEIEGSKAFAKALMTEHNIPTAAYGVFADYTLAKEYLDQCSIPIVIKADGLAAGKGVIVAQTRTEAEKALQGMLLEGDFGSASQQVVIEEFLDGEEFSLLALVHDETIIPLAVAQDHKRAYDGDLGPNTGGMGAYSPVPQISRYVIEEAISTILEPTVRALKQMGRPFTGVLYAGLILTREGPQVIEFNARFGDPETQVLLPRLESDLVELILQLLTGNKQEAVWKDDSFIGVVVADEGYPGSALGGQNLSALQDLGPGFEVYYGGVKADPQGEIISSGGRACTIVASGETIAEAQKRVYEGLEKIALPTMFYRKDIAQRAKVKAVSK